MEKERKLYEQRLWLLIGRLIAETRENHLVWQLVRSAWGERFAFTHLGELSYALYLPKGDGSDSKFLVGGIEMWGGGGEKVMALVVAIEQQCTALRVPNPNHMAVSRRMLTKALRQWVRGQCTAVPIPQEALQKTAAQLLVDPPKFPDLK